MSWVEGLLFMPLHETKVTSIRSTTSIRDGRRVLCDSRREGSSSFGAGVYCCGDICSLSHWICREASSFRCGDIQKRLADFGDGTMKIHQMLKDTMDSFLLVRWMEIPLGRKHLVQWSFMRFQIVLDNIIMGFDFKYLFNVREFVCSFASNSCTFAGIWLTMTSVSFHL